MNDRIFFMRCLIYSISCSGTIMIRSLFANLNFPFIRLFNKTSLEVLNIDDGGTLMLSISTWMIGLSQVTIIALVIPIMAWKGERFVCVQVKFVLSSLGGVLMISSWWLNSAFPLLFGIFFSFSAASIVNIADTLFLTKIAPSSQKDLYGSLIVPATSIQFFLIMFLSRDDILGNDENWGWIVVISMTLCILNLIIGLTLPNDCHEKTTTDFRQFTKSYGAHIKELLEKTHLKKSLTLLVLSQLMFILCVSLLEATFIMPIYTREGMDQNSILTMKTITYLVAIVPSFLGPWAINSLSKRTLVLLFTAANIVKSLGHIINGQLQVPFISYFNSVLEGTVTSCGIISLPLILADELLPADYVVAGSQITLFISYVIATITNSMVPLALKNFFSIYIGASNILTIGLCYYFIKLLNKIEFVNDPERVCDFNMKTPLLLKKQSFDNLFPCKS